jgi:hypothetical protein
MAEGRPRDYGIALARDYEASHTAIQRRLKGRGFPQGQVVSVFGVHHLEATAGLAPKKLPTPTGDQEELF